MIYFNITYNKNIFFLRRWECKGSSHEVTIVMFSRCFYKVNISYLSIGCFFSESTDAFVISQTHEPFIFLNLKIWIYGSFTAVLAIQPWPFCPYKPLSWQENFVYYQIQWQQQQYRFIFSIKYNFYMWFYCKFCTLIREQSFFLLKYVLQLSKHASNRESKLAPSNKPRNPPTSATKLEKPYNWYCSITCTWKEKFLT